MIEIGPNLTTVILALVAILSLVVQSQLGHLHELHMQETRPTSNPPSPSPLLTPTATQSTLSPSPTADGVEKL